MSETKTLDDKPEILDLDSEIRPKTRAENFHKAVKASVIFATTLDVAITTLTGNISFLGTLNQVSESKFESAQSVAQTIKGAADSTVGGIFKNTLKFMGHPATKRIFRMVFATSALIASGVASSGIIPAIGFGMTVSATIINTVRDYKSAAKMKYQVKKLSKVSQLREKFFESKRLLDSVELSGSATKSLDEFLTPSSSLKESKPPTKPIFDKVIQSIFPKEMAASITKNRYMRELITTITFNATECAASVLSGNFLVLASTLTLGITSENKVRTEHNELKDRIKNTYRKDLDSMGYKGKDFKSLEELEKTLERHQFLNHKIQSSIEKGEFEGKTKDECNEIISSIAKNLNKEFSQIQEQKEEGSKKNKFTKLSKIPTIKHFVGYLKKTWNPLSRTNSTKAIESAVIAERKNATEKIARESLSSAKVFSGLPSNSTLKTSDKLRSHLTQTQNRSYIRGFNTKKTKEQSIALK